MRAMTGTQEDMCVQAPHALRAVLGPLLRTNCIRLRMKSGVHPFRDTNRDSVSCVLGFFFFFWYQEKHWWRDQQGMSNFLLGQVH